MPSTEYWNHNTAYHPWLVDLAARLGGEVLDVGGGDGLLAQRLAPVSRAVTVLEPDPAAADRADDRSLANVDVIRQTFDDFESGPERFDLVTFVASLHHMDTRTALIKARSLLTPSGEIAVVGLSANKSVWDWVFSGFCLPAVRIGSFLHGETRDVRVKVAPALENMSEIRRAAAEVLPGARIRRALYTATSCGGPAPSSRSPSATLR